MSNLKLDKVSKVYSFWGRFPFLYRLQDFITFLGRAENIRKKAVESLKLHKKNKVLEVACGSGRNFYYIENEVGKEGIILGFDYSKDMLNAAQELCKKNNWKNITLVQGDAAKLNINEKNFDGVISILGISAVPKWEEALRKCKRALKPGCILVVCDGQPFRGRLKILNPVVKAIYIRLAAWDPSKDVPSKMKEIFGNVEIEEFNFGTIFIAKSIKK